MKLSYIQLAKNRIEDFIVRVRSGLGLYATKQIQIVPYMGYGTPHQVYLRGRVLKGDTLEDALESSRLRNFRNNMRRFRSNEIYNARLQVRIGAHEFTCSTDREGYYEIKEKLDEPLPLQATTPVVVSLISAPLYSEAEAIADGTMYMPTADSTFGIISDIDDTVLKTDVTSPFMIKSLYHTAFKNAHSRMPLPGAVEFFNLLRKGADGEQNNPFFYVSNSPWNLYDLLEDFIEINELPKGPILLRDFGLPYQPEVEGWRGHKHEEIRRIIQTYPDLPFVLLGDAGEHDADIYKAIADEFPDRIKAIYIRDVHKKKHVARIERLISETLHIPFCLMSYAEKAIAHARQHGLISKGHVR